MRIHALINDRLQSIEGQSGESLYAALKRAGLPILSVCGGRASCGACRIQVQSEWYPRLTPPLGTERNLLAVLPRHTAADRLSCQVQLSDALDGISIRITLKPTSRGVAA